MISRMSLNGKNILIRIFKEQNVYYLRTSTRKFISPVTIKSSNILNNFYYLENQYIKENKKLKNINNLYINDNILSFLQNRNFSNVKQNNRDNKCKHIEEVENGKQSELLQQEPKVDIEIPEKISIFAKFKLMYKKYWYVLLPVHLVTSAGWFFGFYLVSQSGLDIPGFLEYMQLSESIVNKMRNSNMGHYAIAYFCYKLVTPLRYAVTLGGTTVAIRYLVRLGYIKPVPTKQEVIDKFKKAKDDFQQDFKNKRYTLVKKATDVANRNTSKKN